MLTLHHLNNSRSQRVLWLLEELGVPYRLQLYTRDPRTLWGNHRYWRMAIGCSRSLP